MSEDAAITRTDCMALRAWYQGLALDAIAERYYRHAAIDDSPPDARLIWRRIASARTQLMQRALQHGQPDWVSHLLMPPATSDVGVERAVRAVTALERLGNAEPRVEHDVQLWFSRVLATRLQRAGLRTLGELLDHSNRRGRGWWRTVPRVGARAAATVTSWLRAHEKELGRKLGEHVFATGAIPALVEQSLVAGGAPAPLEVMRVDPALDGRVGANRAPADACMLTAANDYEAILTWLSRWADSPNTHRAYRKEAERLLAWAIVERGKALSSLMVEDCIAYRDFLLDPQPRERWCGPMVARFSPAWRPLTGPLSPRSAAHAVVIVRSLFEFLARQGWLRRNPWDGVPPPKGSAPRIQVERALSAETWSALNAWLRERAAPAEAWRWRVARAAVVLMRDTGLRIAEAAAATGSGLAPLAAGESEPGLWGELTIIGKGRKERAAPVSEAALDALRAHWRDRGVPDDTRPDGALLAPPTAARLPSRAVQKRAQGGGEGYSRSGLHALLVAVDREFARATGAEGDGPPAIKVRAHALRHTWGVHATEHGVAEDVVRDVLGHASSATTAIYNRAPRKRRLTESGKLFRPATI
ncbi:MAG: phage integrase family protein [Betaproteobacteria bacterium]